MFYPLQPSDGAASSLGDLSTFQHGQATMMHASPQVLQAQQQMSPMTMQQQPFVILNPHNGMAAANGSQSNLNSLFVVYPVPQQHGIGPNPSNVISNLSASGGLPIPQDGIFSHSFARQQPAYFAAPGAPGQLIPMMPQQEYVGGQTLEALHGSFSGPLPPHQAHFVPSAMHGHQYIISSPMASSPSIASWMGGSGPIAAPPPPPGPPPPPSSGTTPSSGTGGGSHPMIHRTGNVHDSLRQHGCIYIAYDSFPVLDRQSISNGARLAPCSAADLSFNGSPSGSSGNLVSLMGGTAAPAEGSSTDATATATGGNGADRPSETAAVVPSVVSPSNAVSPPSPPLAANATSAAATGTTGDCVHCFVSSFPTEKMECAQRLLSRVLQTVCSGVVDIPNVEGIATHTSTIAAEAVPPYVESIAFMNPSSRGCSHSFYARVRTQDAQKLMERVKGSVMLDRMGFYWAVTEKSKRHLEQYSRAIWNLPQTLRHRRTEWLPCTPLILDIAMDTSRLRWQTQM